MRKKITLSLITIFVISLFIMQGCGKKEETEVIKIGAILPLTGNLSSLGEKERRMLKFSEKVINDKNIIDHNIKIEIQDAQFKPALAANIANKFVTNNIKYVTSSTTPLSSAVTPIFEKNNIITFIHSMTNSLLVNTKLAMRIYPSIYDEIECISQWLIDNNKENAVVFSLRLKSEWSTLWIDNFKRKNPKIEIQNEEYELNNLDIKNILSKVKTFNPEYILLLGYGNEYPTLLKQIAEMRIEAKIIGNIGFAYSGTRESAEAMKNLDILKGSYFPFMRINMNSDIFINLNKLYKSQYNNSILEEPGALYFYDTLMLLVNTINEVGNEPTKIRNYIINEIKSYNGVTGRINFLQNGDVTVPLVMAEYVEGGKIKIIGK